MNEPSERSGNLVLRLRTWTRAHRIAAIVAAVVVVALVSLRILAPQLIQGHVNRILNETEGFRGSIGDVDLHLWRGAYSVERIDVAKLDAGEWRPFLASKRIDVTLDWRAITHGRIVGAATIDQPEFYYVETAAKPEGGKKSEKKQKKEDEKRGADEENPAEKNPEVTAGGIWQDKFTELLPIRFNSIRFRGGTLHYMNAAHSYDLVTSALSGAITNLTNVVEGDSSKVATAYVLGEMAGGGTIQLDAKVDPFAQEPTFEISAAIEDVDMTAFNPIIRDQGDIEVKRGILSLYLEISAQDGVLDGYVKPIVQDLDVSEFREDMKRRGFGKAVKQAVAGAAAKIVQNKREDQQATEIPLKGTVDNPHSSAMAIIGGVLKNGFIRALKPGLDQGKTASL